VILGADLVAQSQEVVVGVRVHGNTVTSSEQIEDALRASGLVVGEPFSDDLLDHAADGLRDTGDFERVELLKRFASIDDPSLILVVVLVDEGPVRIVMDADSDEAPRVVPRGIANVMFMPVLGFEDGYGLSYGVRFSINDVAGGHSRISFPLAWGGHKRAGVEVQKDFEWPGAPRVSAGAVVDRRTHPFYGEDADRRRVWARTEWQPAGTVRTGATVAWQRVSLVDERLSGPSAGVDFVLDTRLDAVLPRNAVFARAAVEHVGLEDGAFTQSDLEARGYIGAVGQSVLVVRALRENSSTSKPAFYQSMLGGNSSLRGFPTGIEVGDTLVAGSAELRVPLTSPLNLARFGVNVFADVATIYDTGERLRDQRWSTGFGGGIWAGAAVFQFSLVVAHGIDQGTRVHLGFGTGF
jgi:outer membrane protein assembly factor BamA